MEWEASILFALTDERVSFDKQADVLGQLDIPWLHQPIDAPLEALSAALHDQWWAFDRELRQGKLKHLDDDRETQTLRDCRKTPD